MRDRSHNGVAFSLEFLTHNATTGVSNGVKHVDKALLRSGYGEDYSKLSNVLVGYTDVSTGKPGFFYAPLLLKYNGVLICNIKI